MEILKPIKVNIDNLYLKLINASEESAEITDDFLHKLDKKVKKFASINDFNLKEKYLHHLSQENQIFTQELSIMKDKQIDSGIQSSMQQIFNVCPIMHHKNKENFLKKFEIIGPVNI